MTILKIILTLKHVSVVLLVVKNSTSILRASLRWRLDQSTQKIYLTYLHTEIYWFVSTSKAAEFSVK